MHSHRKTPVRPTSRRGIVVFFLTAGLAALILSTPARAEEKKEEGNLWPGESHAFLGVTVTWELPPGGIVIPTPSPNPGMSMAEGTETGRNPLGNYPPPQPFLGTLRFKGPQTEVGNQPLPADRDDNGCILGYYVDDVRFQIRTRTDSTGSFFLEIRSVTSPSRREIGGPGASDVHALVSSFCPLTLNEWSLTVSNEPVSLPDGSRHLELRGLNTATGEKTSFPLIVGAMRKMGRFTIHVKEAWEETHTGVLSIDIDADSSIRGRLAGVDEGVFRVSERKTLADFLSPLAKDYGFEVEWVPFPEHPESVSYLQNRKPRTSASFRGDGTLSDTLNHTLSQYWTYSGRPLIGSFQWKDDTHLQVLPTNYDQVLAEEKENRTKEETRKEEASSREEELAKLRKTFTEKYSLQTKIYNLESLTPVTAKLLVEPELNRYYLVPLSGNLGMPSNNDPKLNVEFIVQQLGYRMLEEGESWAIVSPTDKTSRLANDPENWNKGLLSEAVEGAVEEAIPDDKAHALIVTAIPSTQEKIAELLGKLQDLASKKRETGPPPAPYRISVVLLRGVQGDAAETPDSAQQTTSVRNEKVGGVVRDIPVKVGETVGPGDPIVQLDPATVTNSEIDYQMELLKKTTEPNGRAVIESKIERIRENLASNRGNVASMSQGPYRVVSIDVKPGDKVLAGQQLATLSPEWNTPEPAAQGRPVDLKDYGLSPADLKTFDIRNVSELGKGIVSLVPEKGDAGVAKIALGGDYSFTLAFLDQRDPYLVVKGTLLKGRIGAVVIENTLYLEPDKPTLLGVTNLREALIMIVKRVGG